MESDARHPSAQIVDRLADVFGIPKSQHKLFLRFAQGDWQSEHNWKLTNETSPTFPLAPSPGLPRSIMSFIGAEEVNGLLSFSWDTRHLTEKLDLLHRALKFAELAGDIRRQLETLWQLGWLDQGNRMDYWQRALSLARQLGDAHILASGLSMIGFFLILNGDLQSAQNYLTESSALYQQLQLKPVSSHLLSAYGQISLLRGDFKQARAYLQEHARASLVAGNREDFLWSNVRLGYVALREGKLEEGRRIFVESAQEFQKDRNTTGVVFALEGLAGFCASVGKPSTAARLLGWADSTREKISDRRPLIEQADVDKIVSTCLAKLGNVAFEAAYKAGQQMTMNEAVSYSQNENKPTKKKT
jgi:tetratricopeptide (TPR) repeat protein